MQRLVARLGEAALAVFAADWGLLHWNDLWIALHGDPAALRPAERNLVRAIFGSGDAHASLRPVRSETRRFEDSILADVRAAAARYPTDARLGALIRDLAEISPGFARRWDRSTPTQHTTERKTITHPLVGDITLDCDVLDVPGADLNIVVYTSAVGSDDHVKLDLLRVSAIRGLDDSPERRVRRDLTAVSTTG